MAVLNMRVLVTIAAIGILSSCAAPLTVAPPVEPPPPLPTTDLLLRLEFDPPAYETELPVDACPLEGYHYPGSLDTYLKGFVGACIARTEYQAATVARRERLWAEALDLSAKRHQETLEALRDTSAWDPRWVALGSGGVGMLVGVLLAIALGGV